MITIENLHKSFGRGSARKVIADGISVSFPEGRSIALMGRNGAGKSTLLRMIAGTAAPDRGRIHATGSVSYPVGFHGSFHRDLTGAQNARFIARIYGIDTDELLHFIEGFADLGRYLHQPLRSYSAGMRSRLAFGIAMAIRFDLYLVDEVTTVGDRLFRKKASQLFQSRIQQAGAIVVTHSLKEARALCDMGAVLEKGRLWLFNDLERAIGRYQSILGEDAGS